jgi:ArsR family transcriptional regulator
MVVESSNHRVISNCPERPGRAMRTQDVFKAISDPTRRQVLKLLRRGSKTAGDLAETVAITKATLSHHFNVLKAADLVRCERRGQQVVYSLNTTVFEDVATLLLGLFQVDSKKVDPKTDQKKTDPKKGERP